MPNIWQCDWDRRRTPSRNRPLTRNGSAEYQVIWRGLRQFLQQPLCLPQIGRRETFREAAVNRAQQFSCLYDAVLIFPQPRETRGRSQFPRQRLLSLSPVERLLEIPFGRCSSTVDILRVD